MPILTAQAESDIEGLVIKLCKRLGIRCHKLKLEGEGSWPDRTLLYRGRVLFIELKKQGEHPTPLQLYTLDRLNQSGFQTFWGDNYPDLERTIQDWKRRVDDKYSKRLGTFF